ncbi:MAG: stage III sporulation protein AF [Lachnospiraceae bacterium]|nr:stage III sporulation protein AF [Lachnospiraceae bacterium]
MEEWIRQIVTYVVLITVLRGLITKPHYEQYFRFFSGIILILLVVSPLLSIVNWESVWYENLQEKLFQMDMDSIREELAVTEGKREEMILEEYKRQIGKQVIRIGEQWEISVDEVALQVGEQGEVLRMEIHLRTGDVTRQHTKEQLREFKKTISSRYELQEEQVVLWI